MWKVQDFAKWHPSLITQPTLFFFFFSTSTSLFNTAISLFLSTLPFPHKFSRIFKIQKRFYFFFSSLNSSTSSFINALSNLIEKTSKINHLNEDAKLAASNLRAWKSKHLRCEVNQATHRLANKVALFLDSPSIWFQDVLDCIANIVEAKSNSHLYFSLFFNAMNTCLFSN